MKSFKSEQPAFGHALASQITQQKPLIINSETPQLAQTSIFILSIDLKNILGTPEMEKPAEVLSRGGLVGGQSSASGIKRKQRKTAAGRAKMAHFGGIPAGQRTAGRLSK
jgi:hypothetical protein